MSAESSDSRKKLTFVDPAEFTPEFAWRSSPRVKDVEHVFCEGVDLVAGAASFGTPTYFYSRTAITKAFGEFDRGLKKIPHTICFAVKSNGNLSILQSPRKDWEAVLTSCPAASSNTWAISGVRGDRIVFSGVGKTRARDSRGIAIFTFCAR